MGGGVVPMNKICGEDHFDRLLAILCGRCSTFQNVVYFWTKQDLEIEPFLHILNLCSLGGSGLKSSCLGCFFGGGGVKFGLMN